MPQDSNKVLNKVLFNCTVAFLFIAFLIYLLINSIAVSQYVLSTNSTSVTYSHISVKEQYSKKSILKKLRIISIKSSIGDIKVQEKALFTMQNIKKSPSLYYYDFGLFKNGLNNDQYLCINHHFIKNSCSKIID